MKKLTLVIALIICISYVDAQENTWKKYDGLDEFGDPKIYYVLETQCIVSGIDDKLVVKILLSPNESWVEITSSKQTIDLNTGGSIARRLLSSENHFMTFKAKGYQSVTYTANIPLEKVRSVYSFNPDDLTNPLKNLKGLILVTINGYVNGNKRLYKFKINADDFNKVYK
ncbi:MAG: hypothetical protein QM504_17520 [Pseudomonadota bacterium]